MEPFEHLFDCARIEWSMHLREDARIPLDTLAFADNPFGDVFVVGIAPHNMDRVYLMCLDNDIDGPVPLAAECPRDVLVHLASSVIEFIDGLVPRDS
jgi:hypothetical protein